MNKKVSLIILIIAIAITSCTLKSTDPNDQTPRQKWEAMELDNYALEQTRLCFCIDGGRKAILNIANDSILSGFYADNNEEINESFIVNHKSVTELFDWLDHLATISPHKLEVDYDSLTGYPTRIYVDKVETMVDEEIAIVTKLLIPEN